MQNRFVEQPEGYKTSVRHSSACSVCKTEHRKEIDALLLHWTAYNDIVERYPQFTYWEIYNHCWRSGLAKHRAENIIAVCDKIIDRGMQLIGGAQPKSALPFAAKALDLRAELSGKIKRGVTVNNSVTIIEQQAKFDERLAKAAEKNPRLAGIDLVAVTDGKEKAEDN